MKALFVAALLALLAGCAKEPIVPTGWATTVTKPADPVERSCKTEHPIPEPTSGSAVALARYSSTLLDKIAAIEADRERCGVWAGGQR